jgi:membrane-associated phospholipid phosphatase
VRSSEWLSFVYFSALTVLAWVRPLPLARRLQISVIGAATSVALVIQARVASSAFRDWSPAVVVLAGYYLSGRFFVTPSLRIERWLMSWDMRLLGDPTTRFSRWPKPLLAYLDVVYMGCFALIPAGFGALAFAGRAALADRYWTMVIAADFGAFLPLAFIPTRPPWLVERPASLPDQTTHRLASMLVEHFTIRANTFPSGHVAVSLAMAFALFGALPLVGAAFLIVALSISVACVVGRYHYVVDAVSGAALALVVWAVVARFGP